MKLIKGVRIRLCFCLDCLCIGIRYLSVCSCTSSLNVVDLKESLLIVVIRHISRCATHHYRVASPTRMHSLCSCTSLLLGKHASRPFTPPALDLFVLNHLVCIKLPPQSAISRYIMAARRLLTRHHRNVSLTFKDHHGIISWVHSTTLRTSIYLGIL